VGVIVDDDDDVATEVPFFVSLPVRFSNSAACAGVGITPYATGILLLLVSSSSLSCSLTKPLCLLCLWAFLLLLLPTFVVAVPADRFFDCSR
jgi:hypothetical protein